MPEPTHKAEDAIFRPQGWVTLSRIVDGFGREISLQKAAQYGWLKPCTGAVLPPNLEKAATEPNLFVDQGRQVMAYAFGYRSPIADYTCQRFGVGTGLTAPAVSDVALEAPITLSSGQITAPIDVIDFLSPFVAQVSFTLGLADANGYVISELGLFSGGNALLARQVRAVGINKTSDYSPTFTWRIRF